MYLRRLEKKDAPLMLEWMHDPKVVQYMRTDFSKKSIEDCYEFINGSITDVSQHYAIVSDIDEYMGTVSLTHIDEDSTTAEISVVVRNSAMRRGYSWYAMETIISKAFEIDSLEAVYWCVDTHDKRALKFYEKHDFHEALDIPEVIQNRYKDYQNLRWYSFLRGDSLESRDEVAQCKVVHIKTIPTVNAGELSFFESNNDIPFEVKRVYYISKVPEGVRRGFHAHKELKQLLFCPYGKIQLVLENEHQREEIELSDPSVGVLIDKPTWREMVWLQKDSVLCVAASDYYKVEDYIRDYQEFREYITTQ